jgi:PAS domain S-box-containing protein
MVKLAQIRTGKYYIPLIYLVVGVLWILLSDAALLWSLKNTDIKLYEWVNSAKGISYVIITSLLLGILISRSEQRLLKREIQYRNLYLSNPYPVWFFNPDTYKIVSVNDAAISNYGYSREEFLSLKVFDLHPAKDKDILIEHFPKITTELYEAGNWQQIKNGGEIIYVKINSLRTTFNDQPAIMVMVMDITERIVYERNLEISKFRLEDTLSSISDSYFTLDKNWVITRANANFYERTGISEVVIGRQLESLFPDAKDSMIYEAGLRAMNERQSTKVEAYYAGLNRWLDVACYPTDEGIAVYFNDITGRKEKEAEVIKQNEQLRKISWLNSHELRKPVASILSLVDLFKISVDKNETEQILDNIQKCTKELDEMVHQINKEASRFINIHR